MQIAVKSRGQKLTTSRRRFEEVRQLGFISMHQQQCGAAQPVLAAKQQMPSPHPASSSCAPEKTARRGGVIFHGNVVHGSSANHGNVVHGSSANHGNVVHGVLEAGKFPTLDCTRGNVHQLGLEDAE
jgi:hypothetical protein